MLQCETKHNQSSSSSESLSLELPHTAPPHLSAFMCLHNCTPSCTCVCVCVVRARSSHETQLVCGSVVGSENTPPGAERWHRSHATESAVKSRRRDRKHVGGRQAEFGGEAHLPEREGSRRSSSRTRHRPSARPS